MFAIVIKHTEISKMLICEFEISKLGVCGFELFAPLPRNYVRCTYRIFKIANWEMWI